MPARLWLAVPALLLAGCGADDDPAGTAGGSEPGAGEVVAHVTLDPQRIELVDPADGATVGTVEPPGDADPTAADLSPDGTRIAYAAVRESAGEIAVSDLRDGEAPRRVDAGEAVDEQCPRWFADGERLVVRTEVAGAGIELRVVGLDGTVAPIPLDVPAEEVDCADPVPGEDRVVFTRHGEDTDGVWSVATDGSGLEPVASMPGCNTVSPAVSPDAGTVAFATACADAEDWAIWLVDLDGGEPRRLVAENPPGPVPEGDPPPGDVVRYGWPNWSPDGTRVLYSRIPAGADPSPNVEVWVVDADGEAPPERLVAAPASFASWAAAP